MNNGSGVSKTDAASLATTAASALVAPFGETRDGHRAALFTLKRKYTRANYGLWRPHRID